MSERPKMRIQLRRGKRGAWRIFVYGANGELLLLSPVQGYADWMDARRVAGDIMAADYEMETD